MKRKINLILLAFLGLSVTSCDLINPNTSSSSSESVSSIESSKDSVSSSLKDSSSEDSSNDISSEDSSSSSEESSNIISSEIISSEISSSEETSSESSSSEEIVLNYYTVTWKNYNGDVLELDENVLEGTIPSYDGTTPTKEGNGNLSYVFKGWSPSLSEVISNVIYTATFVEKDNSFNGEGIQPIISEDQKTVKYGFYPQSNVNDSSLISELNKLEANDNGWYLYEGKYYAKKQAIVYNNESYQFNNGSPIVNGNSYWFECEPIVWNIIDVNENEYVLLSSVLLDTSSYYNNYLNRTIDSKIVYSNNYKESLIRSFLNDEFYNSAFLFNSSYIQSIEVDNGVLTTDSNTNKYICENTNDKVYLLSYSDYLNSYYNFDSKNGLSTSRTCVTSDYARASGAWVNTTAAYKNNGTYWTRSPSSDYYYCSSNVNSGGYLTNYAIDGTNHCIRPCITISI